MGARELAPSDETVGRWALAVLQRELGGNGWVADCEARGWLPPEILRTSTITLAQPRPLGSFSAGAGDAGVLYNLLPVGEAQDGAESEPGARA